MCTILVCKILYINILTPPWYFKWRESVSTCALRYPEDFYKPLNKYWRGRCSLSRCGRFLFVHSSTECYYRSCIFLPSWGVIKVWLQKYLVECTVLISYPSFKIASGVLVFPSQALVYKNKRKKRHPFLFRLHSAPEPNFWVLCLVCHWWISINLFIQFFSPVAYWSKMNHAGICCWPSKSKTSTAPPLWWTACGFFFLLPASFAN